MNESITAETINAVLSALGVALFMIVYAIVAHWITKK